MASFGPPTWRAPRASAGNNVTVTPCDFIEMRLMDVRIPWEPSSFAEDCDRKNIFFELRDPRRARLLAGARRSAGRRGMGSSQFVLGEGRPAEVQDQRQAGVFVRQRQVHRGGAAQVRRMDVQRPDQTVREMADAGRRRVRPQFAGDGRPVAPALSARVPVLRRVREGGPITA